MKPSSATSSRSRKFDKARAYHRRWCRCERRPDAIVWTFAIADRFLRYTKFAEAR